MKYCSKWFLLFIGLIFFMGLQTNALAAVSTNGPLKLIVSSFAADLTPTTTTTTKVSSTTSVRSTTSSASVDLTPTTTTTTKVSSTTSVRSTTSSAPVELTPTTTTTSAITTTIYSGGGGGSYYSTTTTAAPVTTTIAITTTTIPTTSTTTVAAITTITTSTTGTSTTTTVFAFCPAKAALGTDSPDLELLYSLRDEVLANTEAGQRYRNLYYKHALELTLLLKTFPGMEYRARTSILEMLPAVVDMLRHEKTVISDREAREIVNFIELLQIYASPSFKEDLEIIRGEIRRGVIFKELGIELQRK